MKLQAMTFSEELFELIKNRRSRFPVEFDPNFTLAKEDVEELLEAANWAPNHGQTEPWRFQVWEGDAKNRLGFELAETLKEDASKPFNEVKYEKLKNLAPLSSHVIVIIGHYGKNKSIPEWEETAAIAMAVQNIYLLASAKGFGGYWSSPDIIQTSRLHDFFGLHENEKLLGFFYLGKPLSPNPESKRKTTGLEKTLWVKE